LTKTFEQALQDVAWGLALDLRNRLINKAPVHDGELRNSIQIDVNGKTIDIRMANYAPHVEFGTGGRLQSQTSTVAGETTVVNAKANRKMPVYKVGDKWKTHLDKWAKDNFGAENGFALAKHIQLYGTRPHPFIRPVLYTEMEDVIRNNWNRHMQEVILG
jgi:hypothetical protein